MLRFLDVETNPGPRRPVPAACRILYCNVRVLYRKHSDLIVASSQYDILLCSETFVSDMRHVSEFLVLGFDRSVVYAGARCLGPKGRLRTYEMVTEHYAKPKFGCGCCEMLHLGFVV